MENARNNLAEKMEIIGRVFEIDGMNEMLEKFDKGMSNVKFSAVCIQVSGLLLKADKALADQIVTMHVGAEKDVQKMSDGEYAGALRDAIVTDVLGFFAPSPPTGGRK